MKVKPSICCKDAEVVLNTVNGQDFWYCRGCKQEVNEYVWPELELEEGDRGEVFWFNGVRGPIKITNIPPIPISVAHVWDRSRAPAKCRSCGQNFLIATVDCPGKPVPAPPAPHKIIAHQWNHLTRRCKLCNKTPNFLTTDVLRCPGKP